MPNRILKESAFTSEKIASLTDFEFRVWTGLITLADDAGRGDARAAIIRGRLFPFRERVTIKDIDAAIHGLAAKGCVSLYTVGGKPYFWFPTWGEHQRIRDCKPRYPAPEEADEAPAATVSPHSAATCGDLPQPAATCGYNPNPNPNPKPNPKKNGGEAASPAREARRFQAPTVEEVKAYCAERNSLIDAQQFVDFYASKGWKVGNAPMKDWQAAVRSWERRQALSPGEARPFSVSGKAKRTDVVHVEGNSSFSPDELAGLGEEL